MPTATAAIATAALALVRQPPGSDSGERRTSSAVRRRRKDAWVAKISTQVVMAPNITMPSIFANASSGETRATVTANGSPTAEAATAFTGTPRRLTRVAHLGA
ncbi:hypothetical protein Afe04nite_16820 [Asanoa ferruginea]|nr:hypothetical protein Afe04nite_16820 [Asanoa ferruginea]